MIEISHNVRYTINFLYQMVNKKVMNSWYSLGVNYHILFKCIELSVIHATKHHSIYQLYHSKMQLEKQYIGMLIRWINSDMPEWSKKFPLNVFSKSCREMAFPDWLNSPMSELAPDCRSLNADF